MTVAPPDLVDAGTRYPLDDVIDRAELARRLGVTPATTYRLPGLPGRRVGRSYRFCWSHVLAWLAGEETSAAPLPPFTATAARSGATGAGQVFQMPHRSGQRSLARNAEERGRVTMRRAGVESGALPEGHR